ncbi:hypothetical protein F5H01DRAFT_333127 [Linnemannia elongata]|nr:hypothetical protein F5H01DRAFT_333127 [Linnemannia elongata]
MGQSGAPLHLCLLVLSVYLFFSSSTCTLCARKYASTNKEQGFSKRGIKDILRCTQKESGQTQTQNRGRRRRKRQCKTCE